MMTLAGGCIFSAFYLVNVFQIPPRRFAMRMPEKLAEPVANVGNGDLTVRCPHCIP